MGSGVSAAAKIHSKTENGPPEYLPADGLTSGDDLLLAVKMAGVNLIAYTNSSTSSLNKRYEDKWIQALHIENLKIWDIADKEYNKIYSQAITGVIEHVNDTYDRAMPFVCFRGTASMDDVVADLKTVVIKSFETSKGTEIGSTGLGYMQKFEAFKKMGILDYVMEQVKDLKTGLFVTGHSLGGAISTLMVAELLHDEANLFHDQPLVHVTFGAPRVLNKEAALMLNEKKHVNLRFVNEKDFVTTQLNWRMNVLFHTGDCCYAEHDSRLWHTVNRVHIGNFTEDEDTLDVGDLVDGKPRLMSVNHRRFNFAIDGVMDADDIAALMARFAIGGADVHTLVVKGGYLDQLIHSSQYSAAVESASDVIKETFQGLPWEITAPNVFVRTGNELSDNLEKYFGGYG